MNNYHDAVLTSIDIKPNAARHKKRSVYLYNKGDMDSIKSDLKSLASEIKEDVQTKDVNDMWSKFKNSLQESIKRHIPFKVLGNRRDIPLLTKHIKRKINRKRRLYKKSNRSNSPRVQKQLRELQKEIQNELKIEQHRYIQSLFADNESEK